ncbi:MAG: hypothetical protein RMJ31_00285 [Nitrososphaerota archaeon]|nr:hypothetical protein [Nitrososphaerales archaeon]MDW8044202.1 hypothetical protein [Nitrososphaerota archaeon]
MSGERNEVKIRLKKGAWEVEITCSEDKIKQAVESVLAGMSSVVEASPTLREEVKRSSLTCRGLIESLWSEGWFSVERSLSEVYEELARRGYHYDKTAVSHSLTDLVRENILTRLGTMRNYRYVQKKPPPTH